jgi:hypothetical protein
MPFGPVTIIFTDETKKTLKDWSQVTQGCVQPDWGYFEWTEQIISINPYKLIQTFFENIRYQQFSN